MLERILRGRIMERLLSYPSKQKVHEIIERLKRFRKRVREKVLNDLRRVYNFLTRILKRAEEGDVYMALVIKSDLEEEIRVGYISRDAARIAEELNYSVKGLEEVLNYFSAGTRSSCLRQPPYHH